MRAKASVRSLTFSLLVLATTCASHAPLGGVVNLGKKLKESARSGDAGAFSASLDEVSAQVVKSRIAFMESKAKVAGLVGPATQLAAALTGDLNQVMGTLTKILSRAKQHDVALAIGAKAEEALAER